MNTITIDDAQYEALKAKIFADSEIVASLGKSIGVSLSFPSVLIRSLFLILLSKRLLKIMNKLEAHCYNCDIKCDTTFDFTSQLEKLVRTWKGVIEKKDNLPQFISRWENNMLEQFEDKLENYWIASDKEIKELAHSITKKVNQHALH